MKVCSVCQRCYDNFVLSCSDENHEPLIETGSENCDAIANYRLEFLHESTASGDIYRAQNTILKKTYLIKIIRPALFDENARKRFLTEAQNLATIIHPNVARVFESGTLADGALYIVTEFLPAQTLRECLINVGAPSEVTALTITRQAAEGLEALHTVGVLHRNLRPENLILTTDAENRFLVKLRNVDFGGIHEQAALAAPELSLADFRYFSPEQCSGQETDAQTDVYSLGVVLYETLAGSVPFDAPYADAIIHKQLNEPPPPVKVKSFDIRMLLTHTLSDALQKTTRTRLKSANAFARRIRHIEQLATHSPTPPPALAYPATMDKTAIVFTPPAKIEAAESVENPAAAAPPVFEASPTPEIATVVENSFEAEISPDIESPAAFETQTETPVIFEVLPPIEETAPVDTESPVDDLVLAETESPSGELAAVDAQSMVEETAPVETESPVENAAPVEMETSESEELVPVGFENEAVFETSFPLETQPLDEDPFLVEARAAFEEEDLTVAAEPKPVFIDLSTTKLPPLDSIVENALLENDAESETAVFAPAPDIHKTSEPARIEWEQPDDVPTITQALGKSRKAAADAVFAGRSENSSADDVIDAGDADAPPVFDREDRAPRRLFASERPVFSYDDSGTSWNLPERRKLLTGAGILALVVIAVGGTLLGRQSLLARDTSATAAKSSPASKPLPKPAEPDKLAETAPPAAKTAPVPVSNPIPSDNNSDLPNYQPRDAVDKTVVPVVQTRSKKREVKESPEIRQAAVPDKNAVPTFDKKGDVRTPPVKKTAVKNQAASSGKSDIFTRPRIVQNP